MKKTITVLAVALGSITGAMAPIAAVHAQREGQSIAEVVVRGTKNTARESAELTAGIAGLKKDQPYSARAIENAKKLLNDKGFYASVQIRTEEITGGKLRVIIEVLEYPRINYITVTGNKSIKTEVLLAKIVTKSGDIFNRTILADDILKMRQLYAQKGYQMVVFSNLEEAIDPKTGVLTIPVTEASLAEGIEGIEIRGLSKTKRDVILRELRNKPGEPYNDAIMQEDLTRVQNTGIFLDVAREVQPVELGKLKVIVEVREQQTGNFNVQMGFSQQQKLTGTLSVNEGNFRGKAQNVNASWTVANGIARNSYQLGFGEPWVDKNATSLQASVYDQFSFRFNRGFSNTLTDGVDSNQYYETRRGGTLSISRPLTADRFTRAFASVRTDNTGANNLALNYQTLTDNEIRNFRGALIQGGKVNSLSFGLLANPVDNILNPSKGYFFRPEIEVGNSQFDFQKPSLNPAFVSTTATPNINRVLVTPRSQKGAFTKYGLDYRLYTSLDKRPREKPSDPRRVWASRLMYGSSTGNISFSEQYFIGGVDSMRGYANERFWGNHQLLFSNELRTPLDKGGQTAGVLFVDMGDAWGAADVNRENIAGFEQHKSFRLNTGIGLGLRVLTPFGPIRLDYGFGKGGRGVSHFAIGQSF
jgi:outer membrane protein insertion porin family